MAWIDDFIGTSLDSLWQTYDPLGGSTTPSVSSGLLTLIPSITATMSNGNKGHDIGSSLSPNNSSFGIRVSVSDTPSALTEFSVKFNSTTNMQYQSQGLVVQQDDDNLLRLEFLYYGGSTHIYVQKIVGGSQSEICNVTTVGGQTIVSSSYLKASRAAGTNAWIVYYSTNGTTWTQVISSSVSLAVSTVEILVLNSNGSSPPPAFTCTVDSFSSTIVPSIPTATTTTTPIPGTTTTTPPPPSTTVVVLGKTISQFGVTWTLDKDLTLNTPTANQYQYGLFANGDCWVKGPVNVTGITSNGESPTSSSSGRAKHGSMLNPTVLQINPNALGKDPQNGDITHAFDSHNTHITYNENLNFSLQGGSPLSVSNYRTITNGSLVSSVSLATPVPTSYGDYPTAHMAILTVLTTVPSAVGFRPAYAGAGTKAVTLYKSQIDYSTLKNHLPVGSNVPTLANLEAKFLYPYINIFGNVDGEEFALPANMDDYGPFQSASVGDAGILLNCNFTNAQKETLAIRLIQVGIDNYGAVKDTGGDALWPGNGGHDSGRKFPIIFAGMILNDTNMKAIGNKSGDYAYSTGYYEGNLPSDYIYFAEDDQTFYVTVRDINRTWTIVDGHGNWSANTHPDCRDSGYLTEDLYCRIDPSDATDDAARYPVESCVGWLHYTTAQLGMPEWGIGHALLPYVEQMRWDIAYRECCTGYSWSSFILAAHMMGMKALWNHDALFDYVDRFTQVGPYTSNTDYKNKAPFLSSFTKDMWDEYRDNYSPKWVPTVATDVYSNGSLVYAVNGTLSQFGITWTFDKELTKDPTDTSYVSGNKYLYNQYANGDYWVYNKGSSVNIVGITPACAVVSGRTINGSMINPTAVYASNYSTYSSRNHQGYDTIQSYPPDNSGWPYEEALNKGLVGGAAISESNVLVVPVNSSLVSTKSLVPPHKYDDIPSYLDTAAILTVVPSIPASGAFRPPYSGTNKTSYFNTSSILTGGVLSATTHAMLNKISLPDNWSVLRSGGQVTLVCSGNSSQNITIKQIATIEDRHAASVALERQFERPWLDYLRWDDGHSYVPTQNCEKYGRIVSVLMGNTTLALLLTDLTDNEKQTLLIRFLQAGLDLYASTTFDKEVFWGDGAGIAHGRKWPILFAGLLFNNSTIKNMISEKTGQYLYDNYIAGTGKHYPYPIFNEDPTNASASIPSDAIFFAEDMETFYVQKHPLGLSAPFGSDGCGNAQYDIFNAPQAPHKYGTAFTYLGHGNGDKGHDYLEYTNAHEGLPEWGIEHAPNPYRDGLSWNATYRQSDTGCSWSGVSLSILIMGAKTLWNHDAFFDYVDRYVEVEGSYAPWLYSPDSYRSQSFFNGSKFTEDLWFKHRYLNYAPYWTRTNKTAIIYTDIASDNDASKTSSAYSTGYLAGADKYLEFNGATTYLTFLNSPVLNVGSSNFALSMWLYIPSTFVIPSHTEYGTILSKTSSQTNCGYSIIYSSTTKKLTFAANSGFGQNYRVELNSTVVPLDGWFNVIFYLNRMTSVYCYINGVFKTSTPAAGVIDGSLDSTADLTIGKLDVTDFYFNGRVDDIRLYKKSFLAADVTRIYANRAKATDAEFTTNEPNGASDSTQGLYCDGWYTNLDETHNSLAVNSTSLIYNVGTGVWDNLRLIGTFVGV